MKKDQEELKTAPIASLVFKYSIPAVIGMVVNALYNVVDRIFIGNIPDVGALAMIGVGVTFPMVQVMNGFGMLLAVGGGTTISIKLGQGNSQEAEKILGNVLALAGILGIIVGILGITFSDAILALFGGTAESIPYAKPYLIILLSGAPFSIYGITFSYLIRGDGNPKLSAFMMILSCLLNTIMDAILIFGLGMGIQGAAYATVLAQITTTLIGFWYYVSKKSNIPFHLPHLKLKASYIKQILYVGLPPFATQIASSSTQVFANNQLLTYGGDIAIGAMATITSVMILFGMPIVGLTTGIGPIISYNYGAGEYRRVNQVVSLAGMIATGFLLCVWVIIFQFPEQLVGVFNDEEVLLNMTVDGLTKYMMAFPLLGITYVGTNFIQSTGQGKVALILSLLRQVIFLMPLFYILPQYWGINGIWYAQAIADVLSCTVTILVVGRTIKNYSKPVE